MLAYIKIARLDHWFKNLFMLIGFIGALSYNHTAPNNYLSTFFLGFFLTCLMASFNYSINEILDAPFDAKHPLKKFRPVPSGQINTQLGWVWSFSLAFISLALSYAFMPTPFTLTLVFFMISGIIYNIKPIRLKDRAYLDVLCESWNNPIRLFLGWYCLSEMKDPYGPQYGSIYFDDLLGLAGSQMHWLLPPTSIILGYWAFGGFMMTAKRFAELRSFSNKQEAVLYRNCFRTYSEETLSIAMAVYITSFAFCFGILTIKYHPVLVVMVPFLIFFIGWFYYLAYQKDSFVKTPERLIKKPLFLLYSLFLLGLLIFLLLINHR